jgi:hypothetical protein
MFRKYLITIAIVALFSSIAFARPFNTLSVPKRYGKIIKMNYQYIHYRYSTVVTVMTSKNYLLVFEDQYEKFVPIYIFHGVSRNIEWSWK